MSRYFVLRIPIKAITTIKNALYNKNRRAARGSHHMTNTTQSSTASPVGTLSHQYQGATDSLTKSENTLKAMFATIVKAL